MLEPLLHKRVYSDIKYAKEKLPNVNIELITNGDPLNDKRASMLFESGLDVLLISAYDGPEQIIKFQNMMERIKVDKQKFVIRKRYYGEDKDFGLTISNRAGNLTNSEYKIPALKNLLMLLVITLFILSLLITMETYKCAHMIGEKK